LLLIGIVKVAMPRFIIILAFFIALTSYGKLSAEHVFLKDGSIVKCRILDETPAEYTVRVKGGGKKVFLRKNIMRVLYTKFYMGKVYIYKTDGKIIEACIVEEDQENYTVRTDIRKPAEFTIRRTDVLFISREKPTGPGGKVPQKGGSDTAPSGDGFLASTGLTRYLKITARAGFLVPVGKFSRFYDYGGGTALCISVDNLFYHGFGVGVESGYLYLHGCTDKSIYTSIVPFMANMTYRFQVGSYFVIEPRISLGGSYNSMNISKPIELYFKPQYITKSTVEFMFSGGASLTFIIKKLVFLGIEADYSGIVEKSTTMGFISALICAGVRL
jgi:hypothetical protein